MGNSRLSLLVLSISLAFSLLSSQAFATKKSYVVYLGAHSHSSSATAIDYEKVTNSHHDFLGSFLGSKEKAKNAIFYSYTKHINGFAAHLEEEEAATIFKHPGVVSVFLDEVKTLHTTRSWEFLNMVKDGKPMEHSLMRRANLGRDVIIANLDTGVWPESKSFNDKGMGPIPSKWKGKCATNTSNPVKCNRKLIGAKMYYKGYKARGGEIDPSMLNPRDYVGHGTHTLSTAGGRLVPGASIYGHANGTAMGGSPLARVAAYKVCWDRGCVDSDILASFDDAIHDGVDVLSLSIGGFPRDYIADGIAIGSFHAISKGIPVVCSAGNTGLFLYSVTNVAPWILTVAASTIDRGFQSDLFLGNGKHYKGRSLAQYSLPKKKFYPLINSLDARAANATASKALGCIKGSLDPSKVKGKIVFCSGFSLSPVEMGEVVRLAKGAGMIVANGEISEAFIFTDYELHVLPATNINITAGVAVLSYINSTTSPSAYIQPVATKFDIKPAPSMAAFSCSGPNIVTPEILKPDITAPGVNILAAFSEGVSPTESSFDKRRVPFNILSGTSMSCPHVAGIVGLLKSLYPDWSPAAIRSAIMTSAQTRDNTKKAITDYNLIKATPLNYGSGHVRPNHAMDPGLVYDLTLEDHLDFLCNYYNSTQLATFYGKPYQCKNVSILNFNNPSITIPFLTKPTTVSRRVKNVGTPGTYHALFSPPRGVSLKVEPDILTFKRKGEEKEFRVTLAPMRNLTDKFGIGNIVWYDGKHHVRSPILVKGY